MCCEHDIDLLGRRMNVHIVKHLLHQSTATLGQASLNLKATPTRRYTSSGQFI